MSSEPPPRRPDDLLLSASEGPEGGAERAPAPPQLDSGVLPSGEGAPAAPPQPKTDSASLALPQVLGGRYRIRGRLGQGAFGSVLRALDEETGREVALKIARDVAQPIHLERFRREGQITARLTHPGIVAIHDAGEYGGHPWLVYELIEGAKTLEDVLGEGYLPERVERIRDAAAALGAAHEAGVVHRDVKPANVLVDEQGRIRVADFGLAFAGDLDRLTRTGVFLGTPAYMAPEQLRGEEAGPAIDVWALGVMLYEALTGAYPFDAETLAQLVQAIARGELQPPSSRDPEVPPALEAVCLKALALDASERYPDGSALAEDLDAALSGKGRAPSGWVRRALILAGVSTVVVPAAALLWGPDDPEPVASSTAPPSPTAAPAPGATPELELTTPLANAASEREEVWVRGRVRGTGRLEVRVGERALATISGPGSFAGTVPVPFGRTDLQVVAVDAHGRRSAAVTRTVWRLPPWFARLRDSARPPLPLPGGLTFGEQEGEYRNPVDGSALVWVKKFARNTGFGVGGEQFDFLLLGGRKYPVRFSHGFFIGKHEVTWDQYAAYCQSAGRRLHDPSFPVTGAHPVHGVTWDDAVSYAAWARGRLPTEAEWLYAAVGPQKHKYPWGEQADLARRANLKGKQDGFAKTAPVGSFPAGAASCGALDMIGNVYEWIHDWYQNLNNLPPSQILVDPRGPPAGTKRVTKGGGYDTPLEDGRASRRTTAPPDERSPRRGFRIVVGY